jgi:type VI secretion system protein ImpH
MAAEERQQNSAVKQRLLEQACAFSFFKAVHLLESFAGGRAPGRTLSPINDPVRFRVLPGFSFPASDIATIRNGDRAPIPEMTVNFMGLIGPKGVLPNWYNEHALQLNNKKAHAFNEFLDMFHHRLISLFYLAWKKYRLAENFQPDGTDPISRSLADLAGIDPAGQERDPQYYHNARQRLIYFSGMVCRAVPTASAIEAVIANAVGAPVRVEQFVMRMIAVHEENRSCLGRNNGTLGKDAICGSRIRDINNYFIVKLGPLTWEKYLAFQPRSRNLDLVQLLIARIAGMEYEFEVQLILKGPEIPGLCLGGRRGAPLLGRTVLLRNPERPYSRDVVIKAAKRSNEKQEGSTPPPDQACKHKEMVRKQAGQVPLHAVGK